MVPGVPYQILHDPPGDASFASLLQSNTIQTSVKTSFGYGAGAELSVDASTGKTSANTSTSSRAFSESLADANSWDVLRYRMYLDNAYGVYVFDVDSAQSWTSLPHEAGDSMS